MGARWRRLIAGFLAALSLVCGTLVSTAMLPERFASSLTGYYRSGEWWVEWIGPLKDRSVTLFCDNSVMKGVIDKFGMDIKVQVRDEEHFSTKVMVCASPTFYSWVFQWGGKIKITAPKDVVKGYRELVKKAME